MSELDPILDSLFQAPFAHPLSLGQLERRRVLRRRHRMSTRLATAAVCAVAAVFALSRVGGGATNTVNTIDGGDRTPSTVTTSTSSPAAVPNGQGAAPSGIASTDSNGNVTAGSAAVVAPFPTDTTTTTPGAAGCAVESQADAVDVNGPFLYAGRGGTTHQCDFVATRPSGYIGHGSWKVEVYRGNESLAYFPAYGETTSCGPTTSIQPGDHVVLTLTYSSDAAADHQYVRAGPDQHC